MPKLILQFEETVLKEVTVGQTVTIGRLPGNSLVIDSPIVSSKHARVVRNGDDFIVEDLKSTNGTFVNRQRVTRHTLRDGDVMVVGKHRLVFDRAGGDDAAAAEPPAEVAEVPGTVSLDDEGRRELLAEVEARLREEDMRGAASAMTVAGLPRPVAGPTAPPSSPRTGILRVLAGLSDQSEYTLSGRTSLIGKADTALVRLKGWFEPKTALTIARAGEVYTATSLSGKNLINGQPLTGRRDMKEGDVLQVGGLTLEFHLKD